MTQAVVFEERAAGNGKRVGFACLNAGPSLNALNQEMIDLLGPKLAAWANDPAIACVVLLGSGEKAFCAGGDVVGLYHSMREHPGGPNPLAERFFSTEYRLDYQIHTYPKPILCWGHGIVMGGGIGLMAGSSHRVVTERSRLAMPELGIGFFPDVGGTWFLNRMPGRLGLFLGLTSAPFNASDAIFAGMADYVIAADRREALFAALAEAKWSDEAAQNHEQLSVLLRRFDDDSREIRPPSRVVEHFDAIQRITDHTNVAGILQALRAHAGSDEWLKAAAATLERGSPMAAEVIFAVYRRGRHWSLKETFIRELDLAVQFTRRHDFAEGVRALLVDKDRQPRWQPLDLAEVDPAEVEAHLQTPTGFERSPLADL